MAQLDIVVLGLSITSSWGNGHATTYRGLLRELAARGHRLLFLERDLPWYADNRDCPQPAYARVVLYRSLEELQQLHTEAIKGADLVMVGSYVPEGVAVGEWVNRTAAGIAAFYDIDTPVTMARLASGGLDYLTPELIASYDLYLSFTGGDTLRRLEQDLGSPMARALYCSADTQTYFPVSVPPLYDLGYMGTYSDDRQPALERLLLEPARQWQEGRFVVAGPMYPATVRWPRNLDRIVHVAPAEHRLFYGRQRYTLNLTRADMISAGYSPSIRLFEAAACGVPLVSDSWEGLETFFAPDREILISDSPARTLQIVRGLAEEKRAAVAARARQRVLSAHTSAHRAAQLERYVLEAFQRRFGSRRLQGAAP